MTTTTATANPNIAFIKYWENRDNTLRLPVNGSISMNLDGLFTRTTVSFQPSLPFDELIINGHEIGGAGRDRVSYILDIIRGMADIPHRAEVMTENNFPSGAGIASSASAFIDSPESFSATIYQPGNEALEFITEKDVLTTSVVYFAATKIHSAVVVAIPSGIAILSLIGLVIVLRKRASVLLIVIAAFLFIFFAGIVWVLLTADPILLGFGVPSTLGWVALLSAAGSFVFSVVVTKKHASTTGNRTVEEDN